MLRPQGLRRRATDVAVHRGRRRGAAVRGHGLVLARVDGGRPQFVAEQLQPGVQAVRLAHGAIQLGVEERRGHNGTPGSVGASVVAVGSQETGRVAGSRVREVGRRRGRGQQAPRRRARL